VGLVLLPCHPAQGTSEAFQGSRHTLRLVHGSHISGTLVYRETCNGILIGREQQILPVLDVVREVYHGVRETLFDEYEEVNADDDNTIAINVQEI
jgi:hypothetical protein